MLSAQTFPKILLYPMWRHAFKFKPVVRLPCEDPSVPLHMLVCMHDCMKQGSKSSFDPAATFFKKMATTQNNLKEDISLDLLIYIGFGPFSTDIETQVYNKMV
jgi:hypothetical protein